jgi:lipopolysaccharide transport system permease protein
MIETEDLQKPSPPASRTGSGRAESPVAMDRGSHAGGQYELVLEARSGWISIDWQELWDCRELLLTLVSRDISIRYKQTVLGAAWAVLQPLLMMFIFWVIFGIFGGMNKKSVIPYPLVVFATLIPWTLFSQGMPAAALSLVNQQHMLAKVYFPRLFVPLAAAAVFLVDMVISMGIYAVLLAIFHVTPSWQVVFVPFLALLTLVATLGFGITLAALTVFYRDFKHIVPFLIQILMYVSPIIYEPNIFPWRVQLLLSLNPLFGIIGSFRSAILGTPWNLLSLLISSTVAIGMLVFGVFYFRKTERQFADFA